MVYVMRYTAKWLANMVFQYTLAYLLLYYMFIVPYIETCK